MEFSKFLIVFLLLIVPFSTASNPLGATNDPGKAFCIKACTPDFTEEDCQFECKGRKFLYGSCDFQRCCCHEQPLLS
ncbi:hypothetical protein EJD97_000598 [Solanum chilense]|uniref:Defensin-like domain-containing protein n=1 Tax=Solanum chilense TaxID=4083 RepID=A0A6N2AQD0_SOLCI|nr:hypothetical protein EJD97_000598 [Solanum chilense]